MADENEPESYRHQRESFASWLLAQRNRGDWVDDLANAARADHTFPADGDAETVRAHLFTQQVDDDTFLAIDDAEAAWRSLTP
ncbi:YozE family protein [Sphingomonas endolithica]|uniref:YozE family protein n=1 Tax=Sphingomonas endolithica TaxID=2972485 RepID=UPI0021AFCA32|nr:YozE family protein [Sphingomonas sp. ZFBP2030]